MKSAKLRLPVALVLMVSLAASVSAGDAGRILRSAVFPGMGQLGDGGGELANASTAKGLGFMAAEAVCLSLAFGELTKSSSFARETQYLKVKYHMALRYEDRVRNFTAWQDAFDKSGRSKTMAMAYGGAAAAVWLLNLADIIVFVPKDNAGQSMLDRIIDNTQVSMGPDKAQVTYRTTF